MIFFQSIRLVDKGRCKTSLLDNPIQARNYFLNLFEILEAITAPNYNLEAATHASKVVK